MKTFYRKAAVGLALCFYSVVAFAQTGIVETERTSPYGVVSFSASSKVTGISNSKHVDGYAKKYGSTFFVFPVGNEGVYRPFGAEADATVGAYFKINPSGATLPQGAPFAITQKETAIEKISGKEYWDIDGTNATRITLSWNAASDITGLTGNDLSLLCIVGWNATNSRWERITSAIDEVQILGGGSSLAAGSITSIERIVPNTYKAYTLAALTEAPAGVDYEGQLELAGCTEVRGWVWDKNHTNAAMTVELVVGSTVYATITANIYRSDLKNSGKGTGKYGFSIPVPMALLNGQSQAISVRVRNTSFVLSGSPKSVSCSFGGDFEVSDCYTLSGWAWDANNTNRAMTVEILEGNTVLATAVADIYRADLKSAGKGTGKYGFQIPLPVALKDGRTRELSVRIKDTDYTLATTRTMTCAQPQFDGYAYASCATLWGWAWDKKYPNGPQIIEIFEGNTVHATVVADVYKEDLKNSGMGTGYYGYSIPLPASLKDAQPHQLGVRIKGSSFSLKNAPLSLNCSVPVALTGVLESVDCNEIKGYAWDSNYPDKKLVVELMEGSTILAVDTAKIYRADLKNSGIGTGNYGFSFAFPSWLKNGTARSLSVRIKGSGALLSGSPKTITCQVPSLYNGGFDFLSCATVKGWAWDKSYPDQTMTIELFEGNTVYATVVADKYRADIKNLGFGTGNYGFEIPLPAALKDGVAHALKVRIKGTSYVVPNTRTITCGSPSQFAGTLESGDCNAITGFAWDKTYPAKAFAVELMEGTTVLATDSANIYRADLKTAGVGTGKYGFSIALPAALRDGAAHSLSVRIKGTSTILTGSPKSVTCSLPTAFAGGFDFLSCATVKGWVWDKNYPSKTLTVEVIEGSTIHATVVANLYRADIKNKGWGTGNYGFEIALPATLKDNAAHSVSLRVKGTNFIISGSPRSVTCSVPSQFAGTLESADCNTVEGFAWDKSFPNKAFAVELMEGTTVLATDSANIYRADLKTAGVGTGKYGFSIALPAALRDGAAHSLSVRIKGTSTILTGSPKSVTCSLPTAFAGGFDFLSCATVKGWVWDKNYPSKTLTVEVIEGSTIHATVVANLYRADIKNKGWGTGNYGFEIALPATLKDNAAHSVSLRVKGTNFIISGSPRSVTCSVPSQFAGTLESADCNTITGFAWDKSFPNKAFAVELMEGTTVLATDSANIYRADLKTAGVGTGKYGFSIALPAALRDGAAHSLSVRIKGTSTILTGSPKSVTCSLPTAFAGGFDFLSCATVKGWVWDKNYPSKTLTVEVIEGSTIHATVVANLYRADIKNKGWGTGNYGFEIALPATLKDNAAHSVSLRVKGTNFIISGSPRSVTCSVPSQFAGTLESADCNTVEGFAWDKSFPNKAFAVELMEGTTVLATDSANIYRADLKTAGVGTGKYGFSIALPAALRDGAAHSLSVRIKGTSTILTGSPKSVTCSLPTANGGGFDFLSCATVKGWAWDKNYPDKTLQVEIIEGSTVFGTVTANLYRDDIKKKGFGTGNYGFNVALPTTLKDGRTHSISLRVKGTAYIIPGSPRTVTCGTAGARMSAVEDVEMVTPKPFEKVEVTVSPNPTSGLLNIRYSLEADVPAVMHIHDITGREIWKKEVIGTGEVNQLAVDLTSQTTGIYILQVKSPNSTEVKRIVLTK